MIWLEKYLPSKTFALGLYFGYLIATYALSIGGSANNRAFLMMTDHLFPALLLCLAYSALVDEIALYNSRHMW